MTRTTARGAGPQEKSEFRAGPAVRADAGARQDRLCRTAGRGVSTEARGGGAGTDGSSRGRGGRGGTPQHRAGSDTGPRGPRGQRRPPPAVGWGGVQSVGGSGDP